MSRPVDPELLVLHGLRCIGASSDERLAVEVDLESVTGIMHALSARGLVSHDGGAFGGWSLTDAGRTEVAKGIAAEIEASEARETVQAQYAMFLELNPRLLQVCTDWQILMLGGVPIINDHRDPVYDARVIDRLLAIDRAAVPILDTLTSHLSRFAIYRPRFEWALKQIETGDVAFLADHLESYHSIWFRLHEDLLVTLGIDRFGAA